MNKLIRHYEAVAAKIRLENGDISCPSEVKKILENTVAPTFNYLVYLEMIGNISIINPLRTNR